MAGNKLHWERLFSERSPTELSWFRPHLEISLQLITKSIPTTASLIDVGGGDSTLVDDLLRAGYSRVTVLDLSEAALSRARDRLRETGKSVRWLEGDITQIALEPESFDLWHDRAAFHFLTDPVARSHYAGLCEQALKSEGTLIIATFAQDGPERCSGLPTMRYGQEDMEKQFGGSFQLKEAIRELHTTPAGKVQSFLYCRFKKGRAPA